MPYSGPASAYGVIGKTEEAYFRMINAEGGINGRKIKFISYDDAYSPAKAVEQARKLVESDEVLLVFNPLGTSSNIRDPEILERQRKCRSCWSPAARASGTIRGIFRGPWAGQPGYQSEAHIYAKYLMKEKPGRQGRRALPERRLRQGLSQRAAGRLGAKGVDDRGRGKLRDLGAEDRRTTSSSSRPPASTSSSASRRRNSRRRRSRGSPSSAGSRCRSSPAFRPRSAA